MSDEDRSQLDHDVDTYEDEEVPTVVLVIIAAIAVITTALYMTVAGGHNHFH